MNSAPAGVVLADASAESHTKMVFILDTIFETAVPRLDAVMYVHSPSAASDVDGEPYIQQYIYIHTFCTYKYCTYLYTLVQTHIQADKTYYID